jgi:hypothetical protein
LATGGALGGFFFPVHSSLLSSSPSLLRLALLAPILLEDAFLLG